MKWTFGKEQLLIRHRGLLLRICIQRIHKMVSALAPQGGSRMMNAPQYAEALAPPKNVTANSKQRSCSSTSRCWTLGRVQDNQSSIPRGAIYHT